MGISINKKVIKVSATVNPSSLINGAGETISVTVTGAALGDMVLLGHSVTLGGVMASGYVSAADTVEIRFQNESGSTVDIASHTVYIEVRGV